MSPANMHKKWSRFQISCVEIAERFGWLTFVDRSIVDDFLHQFAEKKKKLRLTYAWLTIVLGAGWGLSILCVSKLIFSLPDHFETLLFWVPVFVLHGVLSVFIVKKKSWKNMPWFAVYVAFGIPSTEVVYVFFPHQVPPHVLSLFFRAVSLALELAVIYEIFQHAFGPFHALKRMTTSSLQLLIALQLILGTIVFILPKHGKTFNILSIEILARFLTVGVIMMLFLLASAWGLTWKNRIFGVTLGLGVLSAVRLVIVAIEKDTALALPLAVIPVCLIISLLIWVGYMFQPVAVGLFVRQSAVEKWDRYAIRLLGEERRREVHLRKS